MTVQRVLYPFTALVGQETMKQALLPFYSSKQTGSGLGLPLCNEILSAHGGTLRLQSRPGGGTAVTCVLPPAASRPAD